MILLLLLPATVCTWGCNKNGDPYILGGYLRYPYPELWTDVLAIRAEQIGLNRGDSMYYGVDVKSPSNNSADLATRRFCPVIQPEL